MFTVFHGLTKFLVFSQKSTFYVTASNIPFSNLTSKKSHVSVMTLLNIALQPSYRSCHDIASFTHTRNKNGVDIITCILFIYSIAIITRVSKDITFMLRLVLLYLQFDLFKA